MRDKIKYSRGTTIIDRGCSKLVKEFAGRDNLIEIGEGAIIGSHSLVTKNPPPTVYAQAFRPRS